MEYDKECDDINITIAVLFFLLKIQEHVRQSRYSFIYLFIFMALLNAVEGQIDDEGDETYVNLL